MCRSIKTLRPPYADDVTDQDMRAAALQYVRKISGFRTPAARNAAVFDAAVEEIAAATARLLESLEVHPQHHHQHPHEHATQA
ncbi:MAG TPA: DUF2277 domain-containing protein [Trebonia sp.]|jgi:hypothetical protein|nr:DUF2277 domain-containing protein [Trebonia sp.]